MIKRLNNMKWQLLFFFGLAGGISVIGCVILWAYLESQWSMAELRWMMGGFILLSGLTVGYFAARHLQRKVDSLHFAIIQLNKGNLSNRIDVQESDPFQRIYHDFNAMAEYIEHKVQLLQELGEENVMLQAKSNEAAVIEERKRLARDLHDTVSQQLFAIHMTASSLPHIKKTNEEQASKLEEQLIQMSQHAQKQMRGLIAQLRPIELENRSLKDALEAWFPDYCRQNDMQGTLDIRINGSISEAIEHQLFLLIQEGMANTVKHSEADRVMLTMQERAHVYLVQISDDGVGFDPKKTRSGSYGLMTMQERAQKLGGRLDINSREGIGTRIDIRIPKFSKEAEQLPNEEQEGEVGSHPESVKKGEITENVTASTKNHDRR